MVDRKRKEKVLYFLVHAKTFRSQENEQSIFALLRRSTFPEREKEKPPGWLVENGYSKENFSHETLLFKNLGIANY